MLFIKFLIRKSIREISERQIVTDRYIVGYKSTCWFFNSW